MDSPVLADPISISLMEDAAAPATRLGFSDESVFRTRQSSNMHTSSSNCWKLDCKFAKVLFVIVFSGGCSDSNVAFVTGSTLYNGQPLPEETRIFFEQPGTGYIAAGIVQADGTFALNHNGLEEIVVSDYTVYVGPPQSNMTQGEFMEAKQKMEADYRKRGKKPPPSPDWVLPIQYYQSSTSPIRQTIEPGDNVVEILLED